MNGGGLVEAHGEAQAGLVRIVLGRDVGTPHPVALLDAQRVDRAVAARDEPVRRARVPERVPQRQAVLGRAVELPAQLPDVGHAHRDDGHRADADAPRLMYGKRLVAQVGDGERSEQRRAPAGPRSRSTPTRK